MSGGLSEKTLGGNLSKGRRVSWHYLVPISDLRNLTIRAYREALVQDRRAHDLVIRAVDCRAITTGQMPDVVQEWLERTVVPRCRSFYP